LGIVLGMEYLHHRHILHWGSSPSLIFPDTDCHVRIGGLFDSTFLTDPGNGSATTQVGSPHHMALEFDEDLAPTVTCDVISFGVILDEIRTDSNVFRKTLSLMSLIHRVPSNDERSNLPPEPLDLIRESIGRRGSVEPQDMPNFAEMRDQHRENDFQIYLTLTADVSGHPKVRWLTKADDRSNRRECRSS
jgi:serine/threonine protein kinase